MQYSGQDHPNILITTFDQWPAPLMQHQGDETIETPTLDTLAAAGTRFDRAYSECPICIPARRTLMTGQTRGPTAIAPSSPP